jgi:hypothetical protein
MVDGSSERERGTVAHRRGKAVRAPLSRSSPRRVATRAEQTVRRSAAVSSPRRFTGCGDAALRHERIVTSTRTCSSAQLSARSGPPCRWQESHGRHRRLAAPTSSPSNPKQSEAVASRKQQESAGARVVPRLRHVGRVRAELLPARQRLLHRCDVPILKGPPQGGLVL